MPNLKKKKKAAVRFNFEFNWEGNEIVISSRCKDGKNKIQPSRINFLRKSLNKPDRLLSYYD